MRIAIFVTVIQSIFWLGHYVAYKAFVKFFGITGPNPLLWTRVVFFALSLIFLAASIVAFRYYGTFARSFYTAAAVWMGTLYWLFWASLISFLLYYTAGAFIHDKTMLLYTGRILFLAAILVSAYGIWNSHETRVTQISIKLENLPQQWKGKKVVMVADTHLGHVRNLGFSKKIARLIAEQKPEAVFVPGDFYDGTAADFESLAQPFGAIPSRYGTFFSTGNHEGFRPVDVYTEGLRSGGVRVLSNELVNVDGLQVIGLNYHDTIDPENQKKILSSLGINKNLPTILLKHVPSHIEAAEESGISLQLSGHTHTGQVFPGRLITKKLFKGFDYGLNRMGNTQVYTTSGAGTWGPPQRVGTWGEVVVITFQ